MEPLHGSRTLGATMRADLGRYFDAHGFETQRLLKALYDMALGEGKDVVGFLEGRELVMARGEVSLICSPC